MGRRGYARRTAAAAAAAVLVLLGAVVGCGNVREEGSSRFLLEKRNAVLPVVTNVYSRKVLVISGQRCVSIPNLECHVQFPAARVIESCRKLPGTVYC